MAKFFCVSDIHGYYDEMISALNDAGFDASNEDHWLIVCGDVFDRGRQPQKVLDYLSGLPRKVLVRGNHEDLLLDMIQRGYAMPHDVSNGTVDTVLDISGIRSREFVHACNIAYEKVKDFIYSMVDFFETKNHIFVHGWVPVADDDMGFGDVSFGIQSDWRNADRNAWQSARWVNGMEMAFYDIRPEKTVVCGHWHASYGHARTNGSPEWGDGADFSPYIGKGIIAIDACTAYTGMVNVVVLEDEFLEDIT